MMNSLKIILLLMIIQGFYSSAQDIADYTWKNRIIILYNDNINSEEVNSALKEIKQSNIEFEERDIIVFIYVNGKFVNTSNNSINLKTPDALPISYDGYILIGKDGGIKLKAAYPINLVALFNRIDSMPMRMSEMKLKN